ncbi:MAG: GGDEF domain-containing protein [Cycloclasticus sp.]
MAHWLMQTNQLRGAWVLAFVAVILALHFIADAQLSTAYFSLAALILLVGIVINAYHLAYKDELTQMPSRRALKQKLASLGKRYSLAMVDIDHFKKLNDKYGHDTGDEVLKMLSAQLLLVEGGGQAYRYGGEEFTIVFPGKDASNAAVYLEELRENISSKLFTVRNKLRCKSSANKKTKRSPNAKTLNVTVSIGVAEQQGSGRTTQDVMKLADNALYKAKKNGRNRVEVSNQINLISEICVK